MSTIQALTLLTRESMSHSSWLHSMTEVEAETFKMMPSSLLEMSKNRKTVVAWTKKREILISRKADIRA